MIASFRSVWQTEQPPGGHRDFEQGNGSLLAFRYNIVWRCYRNYLVVLSLNLHSVGGNRGGRPTSCLCHEHKRNTCGQPEGAFIFLSVYILLTAEISSVQTNANIDIAVNFWVTLRGWLWALLSSLFAAWLAPFAPPSSTSSPQGWMSTVGQQKGKYLSL